MDSVGSLVDHGTIVIHSIGRLTDGGIHVTVVQGDIEGYVSRTPAVGIDRATLQELAGFVESGRTAVLLGFNDYAKHLINMFPGQVVQVMDRQFQEIGFREVPVSLLGTDLPTCDQVVVCDYDSLLTFKRAYYAETARRRIPFRFATKYGSEATKIVDFIRLDPLYHDIFASSGESPPTMMSEGGLFFLLELLRSCLDVPGEVAEVGAWQGGSAWYIAKFLRSVGSTKQLHVFEMGESLRRDNPQGIVCHDEMQARLSFYDNAICHFGPAIESLAGVSATFAFVFIDFGFSAPVMEQCWDRLADGGIMLLDNYGHTLGHPDLFDAFLEERDASVIRLYRSPVAFAFKRNQRAYLPIGRVPGSTKASDGEQPAPSDSDIQRPPEGAGQAGSTVGREVTIGKDEAKEDQLEIQRRFTQIFERNEWQGSSVSGPGSSLAATRRLQGHLIEVFRDLGIRSLCDAACGDAKWIEQIIDELDYYFGFDLVEPLVLQNLSRERKPNQFFRLADITVDVLPRSDAVLCRDCLVHLPLQYGLDALSRFKESGSTFLLATTFPSVETNRESGIGGWRPLNLTAAPFGLPSPIRLLRERKPNPDDRYNDKSIGVWRLSDL
jgi:predicted O-methyltransferase YrrM